MMEKRTMLDYGVLDDDDPLITIKFNENTNKKVYIQLYGNFPNTDILKGIIDEVRFGFLQGYIPNLVSDGTGGTYFLKG